MTTGHSSAETQSAGANSAIDESLFTPLKALGLTSLKLQYDWRTDQFRLWAAREWDADLDFSKYTDTFSAENLLSPGFVSYDTEAVRGLYAQHGLTDYLERVLDLIRQGKHIGIEAYYHAKTDIRFMCHEHSFTLGLRNKRHAVMAGGIRRHPRHEPEIDVVIDGLNLGRAMSFKNVAAGLDFGGCKTTVHMDELDINDLEVMGFLAFALDRTRSMTGPDMYFPTAMADVMNEHFSSQFTGGPNSPLGETGKPTAYGVFLSMQEAVRVHEGDDVTLEGKHAVVSGLGAVGWYLATHLVEAGARVTVADLNEERASQFVAEHPGAASVAVAEVFDVEADILCPAAIGGILDDETIARLRVKYVWGPANNQLKASNQEEEVRLAKLLADRGIVFQVEWWHNVAGVMCGAEEYLHGAEASYDNLQRRIEATIPSQTRENLRQAAALGITPTENAYRVCMDRIYG